MWYFSQKHHIFNYRNGPEGKFQFSVSLVCTITFMNMTRFETFAGRVSEREVKRLHCAQSTVHSLQCTVYSAQSTVHSLQCTGAQCTMHGCRVHSALVQVRPSQIMSLGWQLPTLFFMLLCLQGFRGKIIVFFLHLCMKVIPGLLKWLRQSPRQVVEVIFLHIIR